MLAQADISAANWAVFVGAILVFLALDLGVFHRHAHEVKFREALTWTVVWFSTAMLFAFWVAPVMVEHWSRKDTVEFITGYITELSLSMDNVFVIAVRSMPPQVDGVRLGNWAGWSAKRLGL